MQNWRLEPMGLGKHCNAHRLTGTGPGLARQEAAGSDFGRVYNRTDLSLRSDPGPLAR